MSHIPQRKEKDCLNCGTIVQGKYCQNCGQENVVPHETFWHMIQHFLYDITHFDTKFFASIKYLLLKPGFLPLEYMKGRRASYLNPIKKYVFTSAIFFLLFFSFFVKPDTIQVDINAPLSIKERAEKIKDAETELAKSPNNDKWKTALQMLKDTSRILSQQDMADYWDDYTFINVSGRKYKNLDEYDSVQKNISKSDRDGWFKKIIQRKNLKLKEKYKNNPGSWSKKLVDTFLHKLPYMLFVSLPIFALFLKLLYIRHKNYFYADHGIFSIYHYIFTFILLLLVFSLDKLDDLMNMDVIGLLEGALFLSGGVYLYLAMKRFYGQGNGKTLLKFLILNISGIIMMLVLFAAFIIFSVFEI